MELNLENTRPLKGREVRVKTFNPRRKKNRSVPLRLCRCLPISSRVHPDTCHVSGTSKDLYVLTVCFDSYLSSFSIGCVSCADTDNGCPSVYMPRVGAFSPPSMLMKRKDGERNFLLSFASLAAQSLEMITSIIPRLGEFAYA